MVSTHYGHTRRNVMNGDVRPGSAFFIRLVRKMSSQIVVLVLALIQLNEGPIPHEKVAPLLWMRHITRLGETYD
jgi:hypothetical protein